MIFNTITEDDLFDDDDILTDAELWDYAEWLNDNGIMPEGLDKFPDKIERVINGNEVLRKKITNQIVQYWSECLEAVGDLTKYGVDDIQDSTV